MTDRELMQQALEALTVYDGANGESKRKRVLTALRERLAYRDPGCAECGKSGGWALYCVACAENLIVEPRQPLPPQSPCEMTPAERKMFRLGWLECEAAHGIKEKNA